MSIAGLKTKLHKAKINNTLPKIIIPVAFSGLSCEMQEIYELSKIYDFKIIEDASHAIGGKFQGQMVGNCKYSDITIFSFHPVKIITCGEGGMALTNNSDLAEIMRNLCSHGITRDHIKMNNSTDESWYYEQQSLGYNYRMSDIHAALGLSQIKRIERFIYARQKIASHYHDKLKDLPIILPKYNSDSAWHLYVVKIDEQKTSIVRKTIYDKMIKSGVGVNVHYIPVHLQPFYQDKGFVKGDFPESERYYKNALSLPIFPSLTEQQQEIVINALHDAFYNK